MKILQYEEYNGRVLVTVLYDDNTFATLNMLNTGNREEILKDVYIISSDVRNRQLFEGETPTDIEEWNPPTSVATKILVSDWFGMKAKVYDQYGKEIQEPLEWDVDIAHEIVDGRILINEVSEDTSFLITATVGNLTETYEGMVYAKVEQQEPSDVESQIEALKREIDILTGATE